jgi:hypothetical protein
MWVHAKFQNHGRGRGAEGDKNTLLKVWRKMEKNAKVCASTVKILLDEIISGHYV